MKNLFAKDNFVSSSFDKKQRFQSLIVRGLLVALFILSAFTFIDMLYGFVDMVGSIVSGSIDVMIKDFLRSVPLFLMFFIALWSLLLVHAYFRNVSDEKRRKSLKKNACAVAVFAGLNILYVIIGRFSGQYLSLVEGSPSMLYPLDSVLYSIFFLTLAILVLVFGKKKEEANFYLVPTRGPIVSKARFGYCFFISIWMLFALFCFSEFFMGLFIIDFVHGYQAYSIALLLSFFVNFVFFGVWEFYFNELKEENRKQLLLPISLIGLCVSLISVIFYFVALGQNLDGPANVGFGVLPVAFAASVNIATILTVIVPLIVSITALIKGLLARKHNK